MEQFQRSTPVGIRRRSLEASVLIMCALSISMAGCGLFKSSLSPTTHGETMSGYTYIPIDPTKVQIEPGKCSITYSNIKDDDAAMVGNYKLLNLLPDNAVRMSMELSDGRGKVTYGVSTVGTSGSGYRLTADYVNSDTVNKAVWIGRSMLVKQSVNTYKDGKIETTNVTTLRESVPFGEGEVNETARKAGGEEIIRQSIPGTDAFEVKSFKYPLSKEESIQIHAGYLEEFNVPIYVGIGLRIIAQGFSTSANANISGIGVVAGEAEANRLVGSLTVQTLGVNSQAVASALPVQSELSRVTANNAFVAIGSIKSMLHQKETIKFPRVVGLYLPFPGGKPLVNALISELSKQPVEWCPNGYSKDDIAHRASAVNPR